LELKEYLGHIMAKKDFLSHGLFDKEHYEGLLVSARPEGGYNIGIQLGQDRVIKVDEADFSNVRNKIYEWAPQVSSIQKRYGESADLQNYGGVKD
jgi:hypothetical protein